MAPNKYSQQLIKLPEGKVVDRCDCVMVPKADAFRTVILSDGTQYKRDEKGTLKKCLN